MLKAVIFDLDGTLLDRDKSLVSFIIHQHDRLSEVLGHIDQTDYMNQFIQLDNHGYVWKDNVYQQLIEEFAIKGMSWQELLADYLVHFPTHCVPFLNLTPMLDKLKSEGLMIGMITNGYTDFQTSNIRSLGIEDYFDAILISKKEGLRKPDKRIFERALQRLGVAADEALFVGDHPENDVKAAAQAGMLSIWKRSPQWNAGGADGIIEDLGELPSLLDDLMNRS